MPIYEYECNACHERFSALLAVSKRDEAENTLLCPACGEKGAKRQLSTFASHVSGGTTGSGAVPNCDGAGG